MNKNQEVGKYIEKQWIKKLAFVGNAFKTQKACKLASFVGYRRAYVSLYEPKREIYVTGELSNTILK